MDYLCPKCGNPGLQSAIGGEDECTACANLARRERAERPKPVAPSNTIYRCDQVPKEKK
jgi:hypothetical protein